MKIIRLLSALHYIQANPEGFKLRSINGVWRAEFDVKGGCATNKYDLTEAIIRVVELRKMSP